MANYTPTGNPVSQTRGIASVLRNEFLLLQAAINSKADIASNAFTGTQDLTGAVVTVANQAAGNNTTLAANTAHVFAERTNPATLTNKTLTSPTINTPAISSPTGLVKGDVGLGNVDNTSDANKPLSTAQQAAINAQVGTAAQAALDAKGAIAGQSWSGTQNFTGATTTVATQAGADASTKAANMAAVQAALSAYIGTNLGLPVFSIAEAGEALHVDEAGSGYVWKQAGPPDFLLMDKGIY